MSAPLPSLQARQHAGSSSSHHPEAPPPLSVPTIPAHEHRVTRGRALTASSRSASPRSHTPAGGTALLKHGTSPDGGLERKSSLSYGHHRNTSIVHGVGVQHSRNPSLASGHSNSPLSPQVSAGTNAIDGGATSMEDNKEKGGSGVQSGLPGSARHVPQSSLSTTHTADSHGAHRKMTENMQSKVKRDPHHRSQSRHQAQDSKTVGEYALHHLFNAFVAQADQKITLCASEPSKQEPRVELVCGPQVDPNFDQLITALGHIARQKPKPLIDTLMFWRKAKSEEANQARSELNQTRSPAQTPGFSGLSRRNTEPTNAQNDLTSPLTANGQTNTMSARQLAVIQAERRSTVSIYILCRVLMEIIGQTTLEGITVDMAERLEDIIYSQLKAADPDTLEDSPLKHANWVIFGQLLGVMSAINFNSVSRRFLEDLDRKDLSPRGLVLVVRGMRYLKLDHATHELWMRSCNFMQTLSRLFTEAHGQPLKYAYCQLLKELLFPAAAHAHRELNDPNWRTVIEILRPRTAALLAKPKHWHEAYPLTAAMLCASPVEIFSSQWLQIALSCQSRLKERMSRATSLRSICRLVWTYLFRVANDPPAAAMKKLDEIFKMVAMPGKRSYLSTEPAIAEPLIQLIRIIGYKYQEYCFRNIIFPLLNADQLEKQLKVETLEPERMAIGIRAFLAIMTDMEKGERPPFPISFDSDPYTGFHEMPALPNSPKPPMVIPPKSTFTREERLSKPVLLTGFNEVARDSYARFCKILGEIAVICDVTFGGQAVLDEKLAAQVPRTPMADAFNSLTRREENPTVTDFKQSFYDLLHVAVQALPRCLPPHIPFNTILNLLCTGTAHVQRAIAESSAQSLKSIARQAHAQQVTIGFARFIFNFDDRYATMSDGGMLGPSHIENTLRLYVELLEIWIEEVRTKSRKPASDVTDDELHGKRSAGLDSTNVKAHVDEIECHGLFFLCSPSRRVRSYAVKVLRLATDFDTVLSANNTRIIQIMEGSPDKVMNVNDDKLSLAERTRLQRGVKKSNSNSTLIELCSGDTTYDSALWFKVFPNLIRVSYEVCQITVTLTRMIVCARLSQVQTIIQSLAEGPRASPYPGFEPGSSRSVSRLASTAPELVIEQWKLYLIFACTTMTNANVQQLTMVPTSLHSRKSSKSSTKSAKRLDNADDLFKNVLQFLESSNPIVRDAAVVGIGSINVNLYKPLLVALRENVERCNAEARRLGTHQRTPSNARRGRRNDTLRTEIAHVHKLTASFLKDFAVRGDPDVLNLLISYSKDVRIFLNDSEVQAEWDFQKLRTHYCGLMEQLFEGINKTAKPLLWMPFQARKAAFALMEDWCGFSPNQQQVRQREDQMRRSVLDREDLTNKGVATAAMEIEKRDLRTAALSSMAALCAGPLSIVTDSKATLSFDFGRMLSWIEMIFEAPSDRTHNIGRRALKNLIEHNPDHPRLLPHMIDKCYTATTSKALESYFDVVSQVLVECEDISLPFWKVLSAGLHTLGHENNQLRTKSLRLLRRMEERHGRNSKLQDLDISVSDKTIAVYKDAQFQISKRLAQTHPDLALHVFSEFSSHFIDLKPDQQRIMVAAMLPWVQTIELQLDKGTGGPTTGSYVTLANLFEITVRCGNTLHNEIQALWQALATGPHAGNVQLVLDFFINLCLEKREQVYVDYAKQIVVYLSNTLAGSKVIEFLLLQINPRAMLEGKRETSMAPLENTILPYFADLNMSLPSSNRPYNFTLGMLCLILLVDLIVSPVQLPKEQVPLLLEVSLVLWDHYIPLVQDQARELLVHLIHELVISKIEDQNASVDKRAIEDFVESIRRSEPKVVWQYEDSNGKQDDDLSQDRVPEALSYVANEVVKTFSITYPTIQEDWGRVSLSWGTSCHVRHLACRSMQLFRSIPSFLDPGMLADIFARLSNTISDEGNKELQIFTMEILISLRTIIEFLDRDGLLHYPQLFWTTCACLNTMHEQEFIESMSMLDKLLDKLDLSDAHVIQILTEAKPDHWEGEFSGLASLVYKGARSSLCHDRTLWLLERLVSIPSNDLVGDDSRLAYALLANLPRLLRSFDQGAEGSGCTAIATKLATLATDQGHGELARVLESFASRRYRRDQDFLAQLVAALAQAVFPEFEFKALTFLISLLSSKLSWVKIKTMQVLCVLIPEVDMRRTEIASKGPDLISPLLKLLQTEYCPHALQVLDHVLNVASIAGPLDKAHLRMSMAGSHSTRAYRSQFSAVQSLYGVPEDSGWSIPAPAIVSAETRENVYKVWSTCAPSASAEAPRTATPKIEFHVEEYPFNTYADSRTTTMTSGVTPDDGHIGDLVLKLDDLDDFFGDDDDDVADGAPHTMGGAHSPVAGFAHGQVVPLEARENIYDQQTLPILHKSLTRNASVTSFQTGFSDLRTPTHQLGVMTPTAFTATKLQNAGLTSQPSRPGLHARSITSPANNLPQRTPPGSSFSIDENDESFSDDDIARQNNPGTQSEKPFFLEGMIKPITSGAGSRFRSGMRRLTGGNAEAKERGRDRGEIRREAREAALAKSPEVPKVPDVWLRGDLKSSEM